MRQHPSYRCSRSQLIAVILSAISFGLNAALTAIFLAEARWPAAACCGIATVGMVVAIWAMLRLGRRAVPA